MNGNITSTPIKSNRYIFHPKIYTSTANNTLPFYIPVSGSAQYDKNYEIIRVNANHTRLAYIIDGCGYVKTKEKTFNVKSGDCYILLKGTEHHYYTDNEKPWNMIWINIYGDLAPSLAKIYKLHNCQVYHCNIYDELKNIHKILEKDDDAIEISNSTCIIYHEILQKLQKSIILQNINLSKESIIMKNHIDKNIEGKITIEELGDLIKRCPSQASRIFKKEMKITPYEYHLKNKIERAMLLLETSDLSIKEIAFSLGFSDEHYFSDIFKRKTGIKPTHYRKSTQS